MLELKKQNIMSQMWTKTQSVLTPWIGTIFFYCIAKYVGYEGVTAILNDE